jgi:hypothetical protein
MDDWTDGQRMDDGTDDGTHGFRGGFISHPDFLYYIGCSLLGCILVLLFALHFLWMGSHPCFFIYRVFLLSFFFNFLKRNADVGLPGWSSS